VQPPDSFSENEASGTGNLSMDQIVLTGELTSAFCRSHRKINAKAFGNFRAKQNPKVGALPIFRSQKNLNSPGAG
jgi:hypothetical protein